MIATNVDIARQIADEGARPFILNYPNAAPETAADEPAGYLFATVGYQFDEPIGELLACLWSMPEIEVVLPGIAPPEVVSDAPTNCKFTGWLDRIAYERMLAAAAGVICLTSREATMQTGAYEAMQYGLPMLLSPTAALRSFFGEAGVLYARSHSVEDLSAALRELWSRRLELREEAQRARSTWLETCAHEVRALDEAMQS